MEKELENTSNNLDKNPKVRKDFLGTSFQLTISDEEYEEANVITKLNLWDIWDKMDNERKGLILASYQFDKEVEYITEFNRYLERNYDNAKRSKPD